MELHLTCLLANTQIEIMSPPPHQGCQLSQSNAFLEQG